MTRKKFKLRLRSGAISLGERTLRQVLTHESTRRHADVLVLGTHARGGPSKIFFGSTTEALLRCYHGAILVVPPHSPRPEGTWPPGAVILATRGWYWLDPAVALTIAVVVAYSACRLIRKVLRVSHGAA